MNQLTSPLLTIFLRPALPPVLIGVIAVALATLAVLAYRRAIAHTERRGLLACLFVMRVLGLLALLVVLLGPSHVPPTIEREERPKVTVLLDLSESMRAEDCEGSSRLEALASKWLSKPALDALSAAAEVDFRLVGDRSEAVGRGAVERLATDAATAKASNLIHAIGETLGGPGGAGASNGERLLLLSDGRDTSGASGGPVIELARSRAVPIDTVCAGAAVLRRDLALQAAPAQEFLYAAEEGGIIARLHQTGLPLANVEIKVEVNGPEGTRSSKHVADLRGRTSAELTLPVQHETAGQYEYTLRVAQRPEEIDATNNVQTLFVDVSKAKARVLLLEGQPSWDMKFIAQSLRKDPRVELSQVSRLSEKRIEVIRSNATAAKGETGKEVAATLLSAESLANFDVFVLGKSIEKLGSPEIAAAIRDRALERGAAVVFARGRAYGRDAEAFATALAPLEPVLFAGAKAAPMRNMRIALGASAAALPWMRADRLGVDLVEQSDQLAAWPVLEPVDDIKPATIVLARGLPAGVDRAVGADDERNPPAIASMRAGRGMALAMLGEGAWRWALVGHGRDRFEGVYERWMQGIVRWAASGGDARPGQDITLGLSAQSVKLEESVGVEVLLDRQLEPLPDAVTLTKPDGTTERLPITATPRNPLRLSTSFRPASVGVHTVTLESPGSAPERQQRCVSAFDPSVERVNPSADPLFMQTLAERTGGTAFGLDEAARYPEHVRKRRFATIPSQEATWVWNRFPILLMLCLWFGVEWILRRRAGLP